MIFAAVMNGMNLQSYSKTIGLLLVSTLLLMVACSKDSNDGFLQENDNGVVILGEYQICVDTTNYDSIRQFVVSDIAGVYVKTRELVCGVAGCEEAPFLAIQYVGFSPSIELHENGQFLNPDGPFERFESWTLIPAQANDLPNQLELHDDAFPDSNFTVAITSAGTCRIRLENGQGWIEYTRLNEV